MLRSLGPFCGAEVLQCIADNVKLEVYVKRNVVEKRSVEDTEDSQTNETESMDNDIITTAQPINTEAEIIQNTRLGNYLHINIDFYIQLQIIWSVVCWGSC